MRMPPVIRAAAGTALVTTLLGISSTLPAHAVINREYDIETAYAGCGGDCNGSARAWGDLTWYDRTKFAVSGRINDRCPGDGFGAYLDIRLHFLDGTTDWISPAKDAGGCGDADGEAFSRTVDRDRRIGYITMCVSEWDANANRLGNTECRNKDNPYN